MTLVSIFPQTVEAREYTDLSWPLILRFDDGSQLHLSEDLADQIARLLAERKPQKQKRAA